MVSEKALPYEQKERKKQEKKKKKKKEVGKNRLKVEILEILITK